MQFLEAARAWSAMAGATVTTVKANAINVCFIMSSWGLSGIIMRNIVVGAHA